MARVEVVQDAVQLIDLEVISRWSLAVRVGEAERDELIAVLREDLAWLESDRPRRPTPTATKPPATRRRSPRT